MHIFLYTVLQIFVDTASFVFLMYFYFLYCDESHFEKQSFIKQGLLETIKEMNIDRNEYILRNSALLLLFSQFHVLFA